VGSTAKHTPAKDRYEVRPEGWFRRCGRSGLTLPAISLGLWHNFGKNVDAGKARRICFEAFDQGVTHFDLANNYGPPPGSAEKRFGRILHDLPREEIVVSTKAGFRMWPGPYGDGGSAKYLLDSLDQSLQRLKLDRVDLFYHHCPDPDTPLDETLEALDRAVRAGKTLYVGLSNYPAELTREAVARCLEHGWARPIIHQPSYSMFNRWIEPDLLRAVDDMGMGVAAFSPLAQGLLTDKYLRGIPDDSRAASSTGFLQPEQVTEARVAKAIRLNAIARRRGQSLAQLALQWALRDGRMTTLIIGASKPQQVRENVAALDGGGISEDEYGEIEQILAEPE